MGMVIFPSLDRRLLEFYDYYHLDKPKDMKREKRKQREKETEKTF